MCDWIVLAGLGVQILIFLGLIWYACETLKIRITSQQQNEIMQKPCLVPLLKERAASSVEQDALKGRPYPQQRVLDSSVAGAVKLRNIGNGPALNIRYEAQLQKQNACLKGALTYIPKDGEESTDLSASISNAWGAVRLKLSYESLSGRSYKSEMSITGWDGVVTDYKFRS